MLLVGASNQLVFQSATSEMTYDDFFCQVHSWAAELRSEKCCRAAIFSENSPFWILALYSIWQANGVAVPVDAMSTAGELAYILDDCTPDVLFCSEKTRGVAEAAVAASHHKPHLVVLEIFAEERRIVSNPEECRGISEVDDEELALIVYTSGTTGSPKGVMLTFGNMDANLSAVKATGIYETGMRTLIMLPCHHILPLMGTVAGTLYVGGTCVFTPSLQPKDIMDTLQRFQVTLMVGVPRFWSLIHSNIRAKIDESAVAGLLFSFARMVGSKRLSRLIFGSVHRKFGGHVRRMISGGAPLEEETVKDFHVLGFEMLEGYGMTEASPIISFPRPGHVKPGTTGQYLPGNEIRIVDGEIQTRGSNIMKGYYNRPEETAEAMPDGWLHTGDLGEMDAEGYLRITGRKKELIVLASGKKVNPSELEQRLVADYPIIKEAGIYSSGGPLEAVFCVSPVGDMEEVDLMEHIRNDVLLPFNKTVAPYRRIVDFTVSPDELPKTRIGKLRRFQLPEVANMLKRKGGGRLPDPDMREYRIIREYLEHQIKRSVHADENLATELGLDSLGRVGLMVYIQEAFGVDLDEQAFEQFRTLRHLVEYVHETKIREQVPSNVNWGSILDVLPDQLSLPYSSGFHQFLIRLSKAVTRCFFRIHVEGMEHIPAGAVILAPNHQSYIDGLFLIVALKTQRVRNTFFYAKSKHVRREWMKRWANSSNVIVVDLNNRLRQSLQNLASVLKGGRSVIIFPEGTRSVTGELGTFRPTFAILSREVGVPVVPVIIQGARDVLPVGRRWPRLFRRIDVKFMTPIVPQQLSYDELCERVRYTIADGLKQIPPRSAP